MVITRTLSHFKTSAATIFHVAHRSKTAVEEKNYETLFRRTKRFFTSFLTGSNTMNKPLLISFQLYTALLKIWLQNCPHTEHRFFISFAVSVTTANMACLNLFPGWAFAPLHVSTDGCDSSQFAADLKLVSIFALKHQFSLLFLNKNSQ